MKLIDTYSEGEDNDREIEVFQCENCGATYSIQAGGDIAYCSCEFEDEGD